MPDASSGPLTLNCRNFQPRLHIYNMLSYEMIFMIKRDPRWIPARRVEMPREGKNLDTSSLRGHVTKDGGGGGGDCRV